MTLSITSLKNWRKYTLTGKVVFLNDITFKHLVSGKTIVIAGEGWEKAVTIK